jgi:voltage-gated potassium channel
LGVGLLVGVLALGTVGYVLVGLPLFDAFYQTAITVSTVGYGEIGPEGEVDRAYRVVTLLVVFVGAGSVVYTGSVVIETFVEGALERGLGRRRMQRHVDGMRDHVIVAGWGRVGRSIAAYAGRHGLPVVAVDQDPALTDRDVPIVVGDATDEATLEAAGIDRAGSLIAALATDSDNLALTLTARALRSDLVIVCRVAEHRNERKFHLAGADHVVNPYEIGGARMAAIAFRPHVAEFLDEVIHAEEQDVDIQEVVVAAGSPAVGAALGTVTGAADGRATASVIAMKRPDGHYEVNPTAGTTLEAGDVLIAVGTAVQLARLRSAAG